MVFKKLIFILAVCVAGTSFCENSWVKIDDGRKIYLKCQGEGLPTVVLIAGRGDRSDVWNGVLSQVAKWTHVCAYDRPNTVTISRQIVKPSRSTSTPQPITPMDGVSDLHALLTNANVPPPYILVSHSYGGMIARLYASKYPKNVAGLVLIDTLTEYLYDNLSPAEQTLWVRLNSNYSKDLDEYAVQEKTDLVKSFEEMRGIFLTRVPTIVLASDQTYDFKALMKQGILPKDTPLDFGHVVFKAHLDGQKRLAEAYQGKLVTNTHSGHYIQNENPEIVINSIHEIIDAIRSK